MTPKQNSPIVIFRLKDILEKRNIKQVEASRLTGIHKNDISRLCRGTSGPTLETLAKLCHGLNVSIDELLEYRN